MQENTAKTATDWVFVARSVAQLPGGHDHALHCMARAEAQAQDITDWLAVATAWAQDFGGPDMWRQYMARAQDLARDPDEWMRIAEVWAEMGCFLESLECHQRSIEQNEPNRDLLGNAWAAVNEVHSDYVRAINSMARAEAYATFYKDSSVWIKIAEVWRWDFRDSVNVTRCLEESEDNARDTGDWIRIAKAWTNFQYRENAMRCMTRAQEVAENPEDHLAIERTWRENFQDVNRAN